jgi:organic hydroperoxide reductase OsmC/OhrA
MSVNVLYTTHAIATGGRNGHTRSADGLVDVGLEVSVVWAA